MKMGWQTGMRILHHKYARAWSYNTDLVGDDVRRNPDLTELDSTLKNWGKTEPDSCLHFL